MKRLALAVSLLCLDAAVAVADDSADSSLTEGFQGSCAFQGLYAGGCIEFLGSGWTATDMQSFCQSQDRPGETAVVSADACPKANFNALCASKKDQGIANIFVNDMPAFICKKYLKGQMTPRSAGGW